MGDPLLLPSVRYKILVLEYDSPQKSGWGSDLSQMIAQETIGSMRGVQSVGVIHLSQPQERVVLGPEKVASLAGDQQSRVVVWGEFYEAGKSVYLYSHLRIAPDPSFPGSDLRLTAQLAGIAGGQLDVRAGPPTLQVNFAPIAVSSASLSRMRTLSDQTVTLREGPDERAREVGQLRLREPYWLAKVQDGWVLVQSRGSGGWVRHATLGSEKELKDVGALVQFAQGALQYIAGSYKAAEETFSSYLSQHGSKQDSMNRAMAFILLANAQLGGGRALARLTSGEEISYRYAEAAKLLPNSAAPVNYLAVARLTKYQRTEGPVPELRDLEQRLIHVVKSENDRDAIHNLKVLYQASAQRLFLFKPPPPESHEGDPKARYRQSLSQQLRLLSSLENQLSSNP